MSNIFDVGLDFGLTFLEPISRKKVLTQEEYQRGKVDYYDQTLGALGSEITIEKDDEDKDEEDRRPVNINIVGDDTGDSGVFRDVTVGFKDSETLENKNANIFDVEIQSYGDALQKEGFADKTPFNVFGTDFYFAGLPKDVKQAREGFSRFLEPKQLLKTTIKTFMRTKGMNPLITGELLGFTDGRGVKDPFGNMSFRPSGAILGGMFDVNMSIQYDNVAEMKAAINTTGPKGFATYINGQLVTRPPKGFNYTGVYDIPFEQVRRIEAIEKGFVPSSYNVNTESGVLGVKDGVGGMYDEKGLYHSRTGTSAFGSRKASKGLADRYGLDVSVVETILGEVRRGQGRLSDRLRQEQIEKDTTMTTTVDQIPDFDAYAKAQKERRDQIESGDSDGGLSDAEQDTGGYDSGAGFGAGEEDAFNTGGKVGQGMQAGGPAGFIGGPPEKFSDQTTIADDIPLEVPEGAFIINAPAVEYAGSDDISEMLVKAYEKAGQRVDKSGRTTTIPSREQVDIMISRGEVVVPPNIAKIIGYDRLEKINNRGKREVARRQRQGDKEKPQARQANSGGFMNQGGLVTIDEVKFKSFYPDVVEARNVIDQSLRSLPLADALAIMMYQEANVLGEKGLEGVVHVLHNRAEAEDYKDFGNSLIDELTKRNYNKDPKLRIFQFNGLEPTKFRKTLKVFKKDKKTYNRIRKIAEEVLLGFREDFTGGATFFKNPKDSTEEGFAKKVASGELVETSRSKKVKDFQHIYYRPKDLGVVKQPISETQQGFINIDPDVGTRPKVKIPQSRGGSFIFRGSDYERGGASPAF